MVLAYHGHVSSEDELRQSLGTTPHGTSARNIQFIATLGFDVQLRFANLSELSAALVAGTPPIVFVDTGPLDYWSFDCPHVLVLVGLDVASVTVNDPMLDAAGQQTSLSGFHAAWGANKCLLALIRPRP
jgi:ABC-type bacteriocin/lantibiotic exporter with double-glycine peptidase domain